MASSSRCQSDASVQVMTSVDLISVVLSNLIPPVSPSTQDWLRSLSLVHTSWSQPVSLALRQHPIISSAAQLLCFQDSVVDLLSIPKLSSYLGSSDEGSLTHSGYARTSAPSARAIRSMIINFHPRDSEFKGMYRLFDLQEEARRRLELSKELYLDPVFFSSLSNLSSIHLSMVKISIKNFTFLLSNLSNSLIDLGIHDMCFLGSKDTSCTTFFDSIFNLPHLKSLSLTGWLASAHCIMPILHDRSSEYLARKQSLQTLCLSDAGYHSGPVIGSEQLLRCFSDRLENMGKTTELEHKAKSSSGGYRPDLLKISNYRLFTSRSDWHDSRIMKSLREVTDQFGIKIEVSHPPPNLYRIQRMSRYP